VFAVLNAANVRFTDEVDTTNSPCPVNDCVCPLAVVEIAIVPPDTDAPLLLPIAPNTFWLLTVYI
jgi:hypothetical protein